MVDDGFVLRYRTAEDGAVTGSPDTRAPSSACSFWLVDCLHMIGRVEDAKALFDRLLELRNDLGLLSEEYDPVAKRLVGNFPQAFSHVSLVNSACRLTDHDKLATHEERNPRRIVDTLLPRLPEMSAAVRKMGVAGIGGRRDRN